MEIEYIELRHPKRLDNDICYVCGEPRDGEKSKDHVLPQKLFPTGCGNRPYMLVHHECNNSKSKDDKKFVLRMQVQCNRNELAQSEMFNFVRKGNQEYVDAHLIGNNNGPYQLRNYKLKNTITNQMSKRLDFIYGNEHMVEVQFADEHVEFMEKYLKTMARGLFMRNVPTSNPNMEHIQLLQLNYHMLHMRGHLHESMQPIKHTLAGAQANGTLFGQVWKGVVEYYGGKTNKEGTSGWVYIVFYNAYAVWVHFASEEELAMIKNRATEATT